MGDATNTELEQLALLGGINLSDAHSRSSPPRQIIKCIRNMPHYFDVAANVSYAVHEKSFLKAFSFHHSIGAPSVALISYSVSCLALSLATTISNRYNEIWVEVPSFDNIRDLLKRSRIPVIGRPEGALRIPVANDGKPRVIWLANPNNPTGHFYDRTELLYIGNWCKMNGSLLVIDGSFRSFSGYLRSLDYSAIFAGCPGLRWIVLEDTGKYLPVHDLKVGFAYGHIGEIEHLREANLELLLGVSPAVLAFLADCYRSLDYTAVRQNIARNRRTLQEVVEHNTRGWIVRSNEEVPLVWLEGIDAGAGVRAYEELLRLGIAVLPGTAFFENPSMGGRFMRIAINRDEDALNSARSGLDAVLG